MMKVKVGGNNLFFLNFLLPSWWREIFCGNRCGSVTYKARYQSLHFWHQAVYLAIVFFCGVQAYQNEPNQEILDKVTEFVSAHGHHSHYCNNEPTESMNCSVQTSIKVWIFEGVNDAVSGVIEEKSKDGGTVKVKVDCMARNGVHAIVGGVLIADHNNFLGGIPHKSRAYVHIHDGSGKDEVDVMSGILLADTPNSHCSDILIDDFASLAYIDDSHVDLCSKRDISWQECTSKTDDLSGYADTNQISRILERHGGGNKARLRVSSIHSATMVDKRSTETIKNDFQERNLLQLTKQPGWFIDPMWIKVGYPYWDGGGYQSICLLFNYNKTFGVSKCTLGDNRKQFTFDPVNHYIIYQGKCLTPSSTTTGIVNLTNCDGSPRSLKQKAHMDLIKGEISFPYYQGVSTLTGRYPTPIYCLEVTSNNELWTKTCAQSTDNQYFSSEAVLSTVYSISHPGKCLSVKKPSKALTLTKCNQKALDQQFYYDPLKNVVMNTFGALRGGDSTTPFMDITPISLVNRNYSWSINLSADKNNTFVVQEALFPKRCLQVNTITLDIELNQCSNNTATQVFSHKQIPFTCNDGNQCTREGIYNGMCTYLDEFGLPDRCSGTDGCIPGLINCEDGDPDTIDFCKPDRGCQYIKMKDLHSDASFAEAEGIIANMETLPAITPLGDVSSLGMAVNPVAKNVSSILYTVIPPIALDVYNLNRILKWIRGRADMANTDMCWKRSYGRGVGEGIDVCPIGKEKIGLLCYDPCPSGFTRFGYDCHQNCKPGWEDQGLFCRRNEYGRGWGYEWRFGDGLNMDGAYSRCNRDNSQGCEQWGAAAYPKCAPNYSPFACCLCRPNPFSCASEGYSANQIDLSCGKHIRIGNPTPLVCPSNKQQDGLFCYPFCENTYRGVGPVCWQDCPTGLVDCGAGCAKDIMTCAKNTNAMILAPLQLAASIATRSSTKIPAKTLTSVEIAGKHYEGGTKYGKLFLRSAKKLQNYIKKGTTSYFSKVYQKRMGGRLQIRATKAQLDGIANSYCTISSRALSNDFDTITSPEIHKELSERLNPLNLEYVKNMYSNMHLAALSESDKWNIAGNVIEFTSMSDLTGVSDVVSAFVKPVCIFELLDYKDLRLDGALCSKSSECESSCCSSSSGVSKCISSSIGFNPDVCIGVNPDASIAPGARCITSEHCQSSNPFLGVGCCSNNNDGLPHTCRTEVMRFDPNRCLGSPDKFTSGALEACESSLECDHGCCTGKYSNGVAVCTELRIGFDPVDNQCLGSLYPNHSTCQYSHMCNSGCCTSKYSSDGKLRCAPLSPGFDPKSNACVSRFGFEWA